jgi:hypothetical protein
MVGNIILPAIDPLWINGFETKRLLFQKSVVTQRNRKLISKPIKPETKVLYFCWQVCLLLMVFLFTGEIWVYCSSQLHQIHSLWSGTFVALPLPWCFGFSLCQCTVRFLQLGLSVTCLYDPQRTARECIRCILCVSTRTERWIPTSQLLQHPSDLPVTLKTEAVRSPQNVGSYLYYAVQNPPESTTICIHTVRRPSWLSELHTISL